MVDRPQGARPLPGAVRILKRLARHLRVVAVVSGRPATWLVQQLELARHGSDGQDGVIEAYGLHGIEHTTGGLVELAEGATAWLDAVARASNDAEAAAAAIPGLEVENKRYGVTLHWRNALDPVAVAEQARRLAERQAATTGLSTRPGKASIELIAPIGIDKGTVLRRWASAVGVERMAFIGDDMSDLPAFAAIEDAVWPARLTGLKIAVGGSEAPAALVDRADLVLSSPEEVLQLLTDLADRIEAG